MDKEQIEEMSIIIARNVYGIDEPDVDYLPSARNASKELHDVGYRRLHGDVVEVVRCKDCQHYIDGKCYVSNRKRIFTYDVNIHHRKADDFCSYAERK